MWLSVWAKGTRLAAILCVVAAKMVDLFSWFVTRVTLCKDYKWLYDQIC